MASTPSSSIKIGIVGPECSGKTTLAGALAAALGYTLIPEYSRLYFAEKQTSQYDINDIIAIAQGQLALEQHAQGQSMVCDTHLLVCKIWAEVRFGYCPAWITQHYAPQDYTLHLLTAPDIPWLPDPLRENPTDRDDLFVRYETALQQSQARYLIVQGSQQQRLQMVLSHLAQRQQG